MRTLVLMRGLPGSGKSTRARELACDHVINGGQGVAICSTDSYHMEDGVYVFKSHMLGKFHEQNQQLAEWYMSLETSLIIIDNTNIKRQDMKPYIDAGTKHGYEVREIIIGKDELLPSMEDACQYKLADYIDLCTKRNTHGVPRDAIEKMARRFQE